MYQMPPEKCFVQSSELLEFISFAKVSTQSCKLALMVFVLNMVSFTTDMSSFLFPAHHCLLPSDPINGHRNCTLNDEAVYCSLSCMDGYAFAIQPSQVSFVFGICSIHLRESQDRVTKTLKSAL